MSQTDYWYSSKVALEWLIFHYALGARHVAWIAPEFDMYGSQNPESSNPYHVYHGFYSAWKRSDPFSAFVSIKRQTLKRTLNFQLRHGVLDAGTTKELKLQVDGAPMSLFYPIVYRINLPRIDASRLKKAGSAKFGSKEHLIIDLAEHEFDLLFANFRSDKTLGKKILDQHNSSSYTEVFTLYEIIDKRRL
jgi:hypothetical protein